jgi:SAM-dependent methyltransferase
MSSPARKRINQIIPEFAKVVGERVLFVGVHPRIDYSSYFKDFETMDINPKMEPDIVGDIQNCPQIRDKTYNAVVMIGVYEYLERPFFAFKEISRILKIEGKALICLPGPAYYVDKPTVLPTIAPIVIRPLLMESIEVTYYRTDEPYYLHIIARKLWR